MHVNSEAFPAGESVQGTRCSAKYDWHLLSYLKLDGSDNLIPDNTNPSYNAPVFSGAGSGTIAVTLLANAVREGFTAAYDLATLKWTLTGTSGDSGNDVQDPAPVGTKWTITLGTKIKVEITQKATAFANGDNFVFSVFKSSATGGKKNEIAEGEISATDGP
ncbi:MAG: hypothetical protein IIB57_15435 [Planctomycetes bacterium]|nr:hypothetical protein [Planctomycetota bacterium]